MLLSIFLCGSYKWYFKEARNLAEKTEAFLDLSAYSIGSETIHQRAPKKKRMTSFYHPPAEDLLP